MNERETRIWERYNQAKEIGAIDDDDTRVDVDTALSGLRGIVQEFEADIKLVSGSKSRQTSQLTTAAFLGMAFEGASQNELLDFVHEHRLSDRLSVDVRVDDSLKSLVKARRRAAELREKSPGQLTLKLTEQEFRSVDDALFGALDDGRMDERSLGAIRLLLGTIDISGRLPAVSIERLKGDAAGELRRRLNGADFSDSVRAKEGEGILLRIINRTRTGHHTMQSLANLFVEDKEGRSKGDYGEDAQRNRQVIETYVSEALDAMYPKA